MPLGGKKKEKHNSLFPSLVLIFTLLFLGSRLLSINWALARFLLFLQQSCFKQLDFLEEIKKKKKSTWEKISYACVAE